MLLPSASEIVRISDNIFTYTMKSISLTSRNIESLLYAFVWSLIFCHSIFWCIKSGIIRLGNARKGMGSFVRTPDHFSSQRLFFLFRAFVHKIFFLLFYCSRDWRHSVWRAVPGGRENSTTGIISGCTRNAGEQAAAQRGIKTTYQLGFFPNFIYKLQF